MRRLVYAILFIVVPIVVSVFLNPWMHSICESECRVDSSSFITTTFLYEGLGPLGPVFILLFAGILGCINFRIRSEALSCLTYFALGTVVFFSILDWGISACVPSKHLTSCIEANQPQQ